MDEIFQIYRLQIHRLYKNLRKFYPDLLVIIISHKIPKKGNFKEINIKNNKIKLI